MSDKPSKDVADEAGEIREHERAVQKQDPHEGSPSGEDEAGGMLPPAAGELDVEDDPAKPGPPGMGRGNLGG